MNPRQYFVYILASNSRVLYTGVTRDLRRRLHQHRQGMTPGFTRRYRIHRLMWWEIASSPGAAIAREKQIKSWSRSKRVALIEAHNPAWRDLAADWFE